MNIEVDTEELSLVVSALKAKVSYWNDQRGTGVQGGDPMMSRAHNAYTATLRKYEGAYQKAQMEGRR